MKKALGLLIVLALLCACAFALAEVEIGRNTFPDEVFRAWVQENLDLDGDGILSDAECEAVTCIEIAFGSDTHQLFLSSLEGIEYFPRLRELTCRQMPVETVYLGQNTELTYVCFAYCDIMQLDVRMLPELTTLIVNKENHDMPGLPVLDVTHNPKLQELSLHFNDLKTLDLSNCPELKVLGLNGNAVEQLDLSRNPKLETVYCTDSALKSVNLSGCSALSYLNCTKSRLQTLDVRPCSSLKSLFLAGNQLTDLDVSGSPLLDTLSVIGNPLSTLNLAGRLTHLYAYGTRLGELDLRGSSTLLELSALSPERRYDDENQCAYLAYVSPYGSVMHVDENTRLITDDTAPEPAAPATATVGALKYKLDGSAATVTGPKSKNAKKLTIPATIKVEGETYKVTAIKASAFKGLKKLTTLVIGANVKTIGKNAFLKCAKLKSITIKTAKLTTKTVGANAFKGVYKKATVKVPAKKLKAYKTLLVKKGLPRTAKVRK